MRTKKALSLLEDAETRFSPPAEQWFHDTQAKVRQSVAQVEDELSAMGPEIAQDWMSYLHWHLLEPNLQTVSVNLSELELVRRWMFSNREGLEDPLFADLRQSMDEFLDAAFTFSHTDLQSAFNEHVALARQQCQALAHNPSDANAAALGRTLGWLQRTGQISDEFAQIRTLLSLPNAQVVVSSEFAQRILQLFETEIDQTIPLASTETAPPSGILRRERTLRVRGNAHSAGSTSLEVIANPEEAEFSLVFRGEVIAHCRAHAGPATLSIRTAGPVEAFKPIFLDLNGLRVGEAKVDSNVRTHLTGISARSNFVRAIAERRASEPAARSHMHHSAHGRTAELLEENLNERVEEALAEIRAEVESIQQSMRGFSDVLAPAVREGAVPRVHGFRSTPASIELNVAGERRNQFGAPLPYAKGTVDGDVQLRVHISFFNNTAETILGGKRLSDEFLMKYAQILQAELPVSLMVHTRAPRWAVTTAKHRPLEMSLPAPNRVQFVMRIEAVEIDGQTYDAPTIATMRYNLTKNEFDEYALVRDGAVELDTGLPTVAREFLEEKLDAFFAPVLDAGGVAIPDGGVLGTLNGIQPAGVRAESGWITIGVIIPNEVLKSLLNYQRTANDRTTWNPLNWSYLLVGNLYRAVPYQLGVKCFLPL